MVDTTSSGQTPAPGPGAADPSPAGQSAVTPPTQPPVTVPSRPADVQSAADRPVRLVPLMGWDVSQVEFPYQGPDDEEPRPIRAAAIGSGFPLLEVKPSEVDAVIAAAAKVGFSVGRDPAAVAAEQAAKETDQ